MMRTVFAGIILHGTYLLEGSNLMQIISCFLMTSRLIVHRLRLVYDDPW